jgi:hypothetical protein
MTSIALVPANAGGTRDYDPGLVETKPKRVTRSRKVAVDAGELDLAAAK